MISFSAVFVKLANVGPTSSTKPVLHLGYPLLQQAHREYGNSGMYCRHFGHIYGFDCKK